MADHLGFVLAAYAVTAVLLIGTTAWIWTDHLAQRRALDAADQDARRRRT